VIGSNVVDESAVTVTIAGALVTPTCTKPKPGGILTVAVCPKAPAAAKRRTPTICAGILNIEFLK
jgi:hypothetical protein